jgi:hypothetical protein
MLLYAEGAQTCLKKHTFCFKNRLYVAILRFIEIRLIINGKVCLIHQHVAEIIQLVFVYRPFQTH